MSSETEPLPQPPHQRPSSSSAKVLQHKSSVFSSSINLRDFFGEDLVRIKDTNFIYHESEEGEGGITPQQMQFERVPSAEVGVKSARWRKALIAGLFTSSSKKVGDSTNSKYNSEEDDPEVEGGGGGPFWGVGAKTRGKVSMLTILLVLHELACFSSCVLVGCLTFRVFQGDYSTDHHTLNLIYEGITTILVILTVLGFLLRIDTTNLPSLLTSPILLIPAVLTLSSIYLTKAWELQREECATILSKNKENLQNCSYYLNEKNPNNNAWSLVMRIIPLLCTLTISMYMFLFRNTFYLIYKFKRSN